MRVYSNKGKTCFGPECGRPATRRGLCWNHYHKVLAGRALTSNRLNPGEFTRLGLSRYSADWSLRKKYGIGIEEMEQRAVSQNHLCPISFLPLLRTPCVDHIGTFGQSDFVIRGLLTRNANLMLGYLEGLERLGADLKTISAPHVYEYVMTARRKQQEQMNRLAKGAACVSS